MSRQPDDEAALVMQSLLGGGALQDRPYPTSGKLIRVGPLCKTPEEQEQLDRDVAKGREAAREIQRRANRMKVHP